MTKLKALSAAALAVALVAAPAQAISFGSPETGMSVSTVTRDVDGKLEAQHLIRSESGALFIGVLIVTVNGVELDRVNIDTGSSFWAVSLLGEAETAKSLRLHLLGRMYYSDRDGPLVDVSRAQLLPRQRSVGRAPIKGPHRRTLPPAGPL